MVHCAQGQAVSLGAGISGDVFGKTYRVYAQNDAKALAYGKSCKKFLTAARNIGCEFKRMRLSDRDTGFVDERLVRCYIIAGEAERAVSCWRGSRKALSRTVRHCAAAI